MRGSLTRSEFLAICCVFGLTYLVMMVISDAKSTDVLSVTFRVLFRS